MCGRHDAGLDWPEQTLKIYMQYSTYFERILLRFKHSTEFKRREENNGDGLLRLPKCKEHSDCLLNWSRYAFCICYM